MSIKLTGIYVLSCNLNNKDALVKNCGHAFLILVAEKNFIDTIVRLQDTTSNTLVRTTILEHIQVYFSICNILRLGRSLLEGNTS
jgi:hypothetical protein